MYEGGVTVNSIALTSRDQCLAAQNTRLKLPADFASADSADSKPESQQDCHMTVVFLTKAHVDTNRPCIAECDA